MHTPRKTVHRICRRGWLRKDHMVKSMTAFARAQTQTETIGVSMEIRSVNNRYLDVVLRMPSGSAELEERVKAEVLRRVSRGRIEITVQVEDLTEDAYEFDLNLSQAKAYRNAFKRLSDLFGTDQEPSIDRILKINGILTQRRSPETAERYWQPLKACLQTALDDLETMRRKEGAALAEDMRSRLQWIETSLKRIETDAVDLLPVYRKRLEDRINVLTKGLVEIDPNRVAQEAAFLADRSDISEEIVRATSHLNQFRRIMQGEAPAGRKLNFLLQELGREFNTMGSKAANSDISQRIVDVKAELEKIREQVQNVE